MLNYLIKSLLEEVLQVTQVINIIADHDLSDRQDSNTKEIERKCAADIFEL